MILEVLRRLVNWVEGEEVFPPEKAAPMGKSTVHVDPMNEWLLSVQNRDIGVLNRLKGWAARNGAAVFRNVYRVFAGVLCVTVIFVLLATVSFLPKFGNPDNPANNEVPQRYIEKGLEETGAINIVAGMILDYRAFDTLGESNVLFIAVCSVTILLRTDRKDGKVNISELGMIETDNDDDLILRYAAMVLAPVALIFGVYVILNGHLSAGGGFSGGTIIGAAFILISSAFGPQKVERFFKYSTYKWITFAALLTYASLKFYSFYTGANHIDSHIPLGTPGAILSSGLILPLNICVGCVVACTMYAFYALFKKGGFGNGT